MEPTVHAPKSETASVWTDEMHVHFLNTMETSFVRTMLNRTYGYGGSTHRLRLDRQLPDTSESTLDSKPRNRHKKHAPSGKHSFAYMWFVCVCSFFRFVRVGYGVNNNGKTPFGCAFVILCVSIPGTMVSVWPAKGGAELTQFRFWFAT